MSNWAAHQEDLTGLPVAKRARYGIHFQKGSEIEAHFVGKPCHYQDGGIWKPIDTALLTTADGGFSSPHSDVIIYQDGRVRVKDSDYQQFTELPGAKVGKLAGDKIIREFPGGEQHLVMKEDGFREEIHLFKPTFKLEKFIAKTTGNLPGHYKAHPVTAEDAEGNSYTFTGDTKAFGVWLDKAVYPVVIDPDLVLQPDSTTGKDTFIVSTGPANHYENTAYFWWQLTVTGLMFYDLSSIPAGATISAANFLLTAQGTMNRTVTHTFYRILEANDGWVEACNWNFRDGAGASQRWAGDTGNDGGADAGCSVSGTDYSATPLGSVNATAGETAGTTYSTNFNLTECALLVANNYGICERSGGGSFNPFSSSEHATASYRPKLTITYTAGGVPKHFMHYARLRG